MSNNIHIKRFYGVERTTETYNRLLGEMGVTDVTEGESLYDLYCFHVGGVSYNGEPLKSFIDLPYTIMKAWVSITIKP